LIEKLKLNYCQKQSFKHITRKLITGITQFKFSNLDEEEITEITIEEKCKERRGPGINQ
jgi:hypothetical protein